MIAALLATILSAIAPAVSPASLLPPCVHEDGSGGPLPCIWQADRSGNEFGESFIISDGGVTFYLKHAQVMPQPDGGTYMRCDDGFVALDSPAGEPVWVRCIQQQEGV